MTQRTTGGATAETVRVELAKRGMSGRALARATGMAPSRVHRLLRGDYPFTVEELGDVAAVLDLPLTAFLPAPRTEAAS